MDGVPPSYNEMLYLMQIEDVENLSLLFSAARDTKYKYFGRKVFLYGFIYFSTYCKNSCAFCYYRLGNTICPRYRKDANEIIEVARALKDAGVHLVDLTMGEDPLIHVGGYDILVKLVKRVREEVDISIMVSPGVLPKSVLRRLAEVGTDWYALYQETHNRELFHKLRVGQDYDERMRAKLNAKEEGLLIEEGILINIGETIFDRLHSIFVMKEIGAHQVRAMNFIPQPGTPMENMPEGPALDEIKTISIMRLMHQDRLIPASLDVCKNTYDLKLRLMAGANVITSIIPPKHGLKGVASPDKGIEEGFRSPEMIKLYVESLGLSVASREEYEKWVEEEKLKIAKK